MLLARVSRPPVIERMLAFCERVVIMLWRRSTNFGRSNSQRKSFSKVGGPRPAALKFYRVTRWGGAFDDCGNERPKAVAGYPPLQESLLVDFQGGKPFAAGFAALS